MKQLLRNVFSFVLNRFEKGDEPYHYDKTHRAITIAVGVLFMVIAAISVYLITILQTPAAVLPVIVFGGVSLISLIVGLLGNDRAIARIWNSR